MIPLRIRPFRPEDAIALHEAAQESVETVGRWLWWCRADYSLAQVGEWIGSRQAAVERGEEFDFGIFSLEGHLLGGCAVNEIHLRDRRANLGYWVRVSATGRGIATAAACRLAHWAFRHLDLERLEIVVACGNTGSLKVAEKCGAIREGVLRHRLMVGNEPQDAVMFSLLKGETESGNGAPSASGEAP